jgi:hypothetical protein
VSRLAAAVTVVLSGVVLAPAFAPRGWDDFPISSYPMFARGDLGAVVALDRVLVTRADGSVAPAPPSALGTPEAMVAMKVVSGAVARGDARALCARVLAAVRAEPSAGRAPAVGAAVQTDTYDTRVYFGEPRRAVLGTNLHATCSAEAP